MKRSRNFTIKLFLTLTVICFFAFLLESCKKEASSDVNQDKIYAEYELFYDKNTDKTYASAIFKFSNVAGTQLELTAPSEIKFNGDIIPFDPVFAYYRKEYSGRINSGTFVFKDTNGKSYANSVNLAKDIQNLAIDTIGRTGSYTYTWGGNALAANEAIGLTIINYTNKANFQYFLQYTVNSTNIVLSLKQLNQLPIGMAYCQLDRQIETDASQVTSAGGRIRGKYRALNSDVYIK
jgi:hypothetical protein